MTAYATYASSLQQGDIAPGSTNLVNEITGLQVNYGAEISAQGTLFRRLLVDGGFTALNARLNNTGIAATNGKHFVGIPGYKSNFYSEYRVSAVANLSVTGDWQFVGRRPQDDENLHSTGGYNIYDLGFRYSYMLFTKLATLRSTTNNLTDVHYFSTISAGDITGTNASSNLAYFGSPRTISTSLQFAF
jgi:iron complex outermembrane receptor protein